MSIGKERPRTRKSLILIGVLSAGLTGLVAGAVGGAAGAVWVVETMAKPRYSPKIKNAVLKYEMPKQGARPVDIAGVQKTGTPLHSCLIKFLNGPANEMLPNANWKRVRLSPYFKTENDIITEMAFARGAIAITRQNEITIRVPDSQEQWEGGWENLMFHELVHVDQYASGRLDLPDYAASTARAYADGRLPQENDYENEARASAKALVKMWFASDERKTCHQDAEGPKRSASEKPLVTYAIFDRESQEYRVVETKLNAKL